MIDPSIPAEGVMTPQDKRVPCTQEPPSLFGQFKGQIKVTGDIQASLEAEWDAQPPC